MKVATAVNEWTRGERSFVSLIAKAFDLTDKRPYYEPAQTPGDD